MVEARRRVVICIAVDSEARCTSCLRSVVMHTGAEVPIVLCADADGPDNRHRLDRALEQVSATRTVQSGAPETVFASTAPADVVVLNPDSVVAGGWLDGLQDAAYAAHALASASPLIHHDPSSFEDAAAALRSSSLRPRPRIEALVPECTYLRRAALDLLPDCHLHDVGADGNFSRRCVSLGLRHVLASEVLVLHAERPAPGLTAPAAGGSALQRSWSSARRRLAGLSVVVDARVLTGPVSGTHVQVIEVIAALARTRRVALTAVVPDDLAEVAETALRALPSVEIVHHADAPRAVGARGSIVHRPYQLNDPGDVPFLASLGDRLVVTHQDLISYHNPSYFRDFAAWHGHRRLTRMALALADHVAFVSAHARADAVAEDLVEPTRTSVVPNGVRHAVVGLSDARARPAPTWALPADAETILCLGTDYGHKNRLFALRILEQLRLRHRWGGYLVFAGPHVAAGSSHADESEWLSDRARLRDRVIDCSAVTEAEKAWLVERAGVVLYPTTFEGFGLVPFEAAQCGVPCAWAPGTSLSEILPDEEAVLVAWDAGESADHVLRLMRDDVARERHVSAVRAAGAALTWDATAAQLIDVYNAVGEGPPPPLSALHRSDGLMSGAVSQDALQLFGPGGALPRGLERPLAGLARHPHLADPVFGALRLGYRAGFKLQRRRQRRT